MMNQNYTLKVNIRAQEERERREKERAARDSLIKVVAGGPVARPRKGKGLQFNEPGKYIIEGERLRKKERLEALQKRIAASAAKTGITDAVKLASLTNKASATPSIKYHHQKTTGDHKSTQIKEDDDDEVPEIEWWDKLLLKNTPIEMAIIRLDQNMNPEDIIHGITNLIEHPSIKKPSDADAPVPAPIFLTKSERKKLRRQNRRNAELDKQEKIKLGLLPKPEAKLKQSNILYTLGQEATVNPSKVEQIVKEQEAKRQKAHLDHNAEKKLTPEQRREKKLLKLREDICTDGVKVSVYRIANLSCPAHKFKVIKNAKQLALTGMLILYKDINIVVVEGGPSRQRKYRHLLLERIKWAEDPLEAITNGEHSLKDNKCQLLWDGQVSTKAFKVFKVKTVQTEQEARDLFRKFNIEHYWDLAFKMNILGTISE